MLIKSKINLYKNDDLQVFNFKAIGIVIESLTKNLYDHKFTQLPFSYINGQQTLRILNDTVCSHIFYFIKFYIYKLFFYLIGPFWKCDFIFFQNLKYYFPNFFNIPNFNFIRKNLVH